MDNSEFREQLKQRTEEVNLILEKYLPAEEGRQKTVLEAMNYSVRAGGKRIRPIFMQETFNVCEGTAEDRGLLEPFMVAIEMIHTYSLVHDDLPAMDNDEYRRGKKTTWAVYGETMGILAGDGLLNYAFETAMQAFSACGADGKRQERLERVAASLQILAKKAGVYGMIGGQTADIEAEGQREGTTKEQLLFIHAHKTAALIEASMMIGACLAGASQRVLEQLEKCAYNVGVAFQIQDDILDVTGDSAELGKQVGSDEKQDKQTYVTLEGLEQSQREVAALSAEAVALLKDFGDRQAFLTQLILEMVHRRR